MNKWRIVVDSSVDFQATELSLEDVDMKIVPLQIVVGNQIFVDDENLDVMELLKKMDEEKEGSKTTCPSPGQFLECYRGAENVLCFTITGLLSGTYNSAVLASAMAKEEQETMNIFVLDSHSTAGHLALLVKKAATLIQQELSFEEICQELETYNQEIQIMAILGNFDNLVKTGRMNPIVGGIADTLSIKAIVQNTHEGQIMPIKKARGFKGAYKKLVDTIFSVDRDLEGCPMYISHCNNEQGALKVKELIVEKGKHNPIYITTCKGLTTFYAMDQGIIVGF